MIHSKTVLSALPKVLKTIDLGGLGRKQQGKVRDFYILPDKRVIITTDRQSAFDVILGYIPFKGAVLNLLSQYWFEKTKHIVPNHMIRVPHPNVMVVKECQPIPVEMIVRGYISGVTKTSIWYSYERGERTIYGIKFPEGLRKNQKLPNSVITPTTHPLAGSAIHDERLTREEIISRAIVDKKLYAKMEEVSFALFDYGSNLCQKRGLILVDTKYEFGLYKGKLMLIDEIHTPDSSRFWTKESYDRIFHTDESGEAPNRRSSDARTPLNNGVNSDSGGGKSGSGEPKNFDKEFLRLWYVQRGYLGDGAPPKMSRDLIVALAKRYIRVYEKITGTKFKAYEYPIEKEIINQTKKYLS